LLLLICVLPTLEQQVPPLRSLSAREDPQLVVEALLVQERMVLLDQMGRRRRSARSSRREEAEEEAEERLREVSVEAEVEQPRVLLRTLKERQVLRMLPESLVRELLEQQSRPRSQQSGVEELVELEEFHLALQEDRQSSVVPLAEAEEL